MKKITLFLATALAIAFGNNEARSQDVAGDFVITAGAGYGLAAAFFNIFPNVKVVPPINGMVDFAVADEFSLGAAYTFSSFSYSEDYVDLLDPTFNETIDITAKRQSFGLRPLYHFSADNEKVDGYVGGRVGYTTWSFTDNSTVSGFESEGVRGGAVAIQALVGWRVYFTDIIGMNFEFGIGNAPYAVALGLNLKL